MPIHFVWGPQLRPFRAVSKDVYEIPVKLVINAVEPVELKVEVLIWCFSGPSFVFFGQGQNSGGRAPKLVDVPIFPYRLVVLSATFPAPTNEATDQKHIRMTYQNQWMAIPKCSRFYHFNLCIRGAYILLFRGSLKKHYSTLNSA